MTDGSHAGVEEVRAASALADCGGKGCCEGRHGAVA